MANKEDFVMPKYNPNDLVELCHSVGFSLLQIQSFEYNIEIYLALVHKLEPKMAREEAENIFDKCGKMTLGQLFREIESEEELPEELHNRIHNFIKERNWLVHKCRKENQANLYNSEKFPFTLKRIEKVAEESLLLSKYFDKKAEEYLLNNGIMTKEELDHNTQVILDSWSKV